MTRDIITVILLSVSFLAMTCGQSHSPTVHNALSESVDLTVTYSSGQSFSGHFPAGATVYAPAEGLILDRVEVRVDSRVLFVVDKDKLADLQSQIRPGSRVMWSIDENGVNPVAEGD